MTLFIIEQLMRGLWEIYSEDTPGKYAKPAVFTSLQDAEARAAGLSREYNGIFSARAVDSENRTLYINGRMIPLYNSDTISYQIEERRDDWVTLNAQIMIYDWETAAHIACGLSQQDCERVYRVSDPLNRRPAMRFAQGHPNIN